MTRSRQATQYFDEMERRGVFARRTAQLGSVPSAPPANEYGWRDLNTNEGRTVTGCTPKDSVENTACTMMSVFGWCNPELMVDMEEEIKTKIHELNAIYWSKADQWKLNEEEMKRERTKREIADMLKWNDLRTATYTDGTVEIPDGPNQCFLSDGTPVRLARVAIATGNGEMFEYDCMPSMGAHPTWLPAQEGNDCWRGNRGWAMRIARAQELAGEEKTASVNTREWRIPSPAPDLNPTQQSPAFVSLASIQRSQELKEQRQKAYNEFMHPEDPSRGTPLSVYDDIDDSSDDEE